MSTNLIKSLSLLVLLSVNTKIFSQWNINKNPPSIWTDEKVGIGTDDPKSLIHSNFKCLGSYTFEEVYENYMPIINGRTPSNKHYTLTDYPSINEEVKVVDIRDNRNFFSKDVTTVVTYLADINCDDQFEYSFHTQPYKKAFELKGKTSLNSNEFTAIYVDESNVEIPLPLNLKSDLRINDGSQNVFAVFTDGKVRAREIKVDFDIIPDYVFKEGYKLMPLQDLENFIKTEKHLPNIKSEKEFDKTEGMGLGEMNLKLLEKVEELTLYVIELQKQINNLKNK